MSKIIVIGTGAMGSGIAASFLAHGATTIILGRDQAKAEATFPVIEACAKTIDSACSSGQLIAGAIAHWHEWADTDLIIETVSEQLDLKKRIFSELDQRVPKNIPIGTNSSGFAISDIAENKVTAHRMFNVHYLMPAHVVPLVEVVLGTQSDPALAQKICELIRAHGKKPILIKRDIPGLLASRLQHALMREALSLVQEGIVTPEDIDIAVRFGFGFRYAAVGPMAQKEMSGWDTHVLSAQTVYPSLSTIDTPPACVTDLVKQGKTGMSKGAGFWEWSPQGLARFKRNYGMRLKAAFDVLNIVPDEN